MEVCRFFSSHAVEIETGWLVDDAEKLPDNVSTNACSHADALAGNTAVYRGPVWFRFFLSIFGPKTQNLTQTLRFFC
jgi:hypothetical protein